MATTLKTALATGCLSLALLACGGGGGGDRAPGVEPGPTPPGGPVEPPPPILPSDTVDASELTSADRVEANITGISLNSPPTVTFTLVANGLQKVGGVQSDDLSATFVKLVPGIEAGTLDWQSVVALNSEDPVCRNGEDVSDSNNQCTEFTENTTPETIPDAARKVQDPVATGKVATTHVTSERGGTLVENPDGSWSYTLVTDPGDPAALADPHRVCFQFSLGATTNNPCIDFVPQDLVNPAIGVRATSLDSGFYQNYTSRQMIADATCNSCHAQLAFHGGGRRDVDYCVTCHNPDTIDANSENSADFKVMAHRIHAGINLPSVAGDPDAIPPVAGVPYKIWGFRNGEHDYSSIHYPQGLNNCTRCHAGQADVDYAMANGLPEPEAEITADGHNWVTYAGRVACESCHDDKLRHGGGGETACIACHDNVQERHRNQQDESARALTLEIESVTRTGPGQSPLVTFNLQRNGVAIDIKNPTVFDGKLIIGIAWDAATDFDNEGISGFSSLNIELDAIADSTALGGNRFQLDTAPNTIPAGKDTLGVMLFGHEGDVDAGEPLSAIESVLGFYASEASAPTERRDVVDIEQCDSCHHRLAMTDSSHAGFHAAPAENPRLCAACHGPGLGFSVSTDFRVLIHGLHASGMRQTPYRGYDTDRLQYPGDLKDCESCHLPGTWGLPVPVKSVPLKDGDGSGDQFSTPEASACAACHDSDSAKTHMVSAGGAMFSVSRTAAANAIETCDVCHKNGASAGVDVVHAK